MMFHWKVLNTEKTNKKKKNSFYKNYRTVELVIIYEKLYLISILGDVTMYTLHFTCYYYDFSNQNSIYS